MLLAVRIWSYGCTWDVWRAIKKLELLSHLSSSPNFRRAPITRYTHAKHEQILKFRIRKTIRIHILLQQKYEISICNNQNSFNYKET